MTADADLNGTESGRALRGRLMALDHRLFEAVAARHFPGGDRLLPRLSRSANHGVLWFGTAALLAATGSPRARRAAVRGVASLALASATINTVGKRSVRRRRPVLDAVPAIRRLKRQPITTSFPSGHSASAAAFAAGVALESRPLGAAVAPLAASVILSRVYTGVHYPGDVVVGAALGVGAAFAVRGLVPTRDVLPLPGRTCADVPALPDGDGLVLVADRTAGGAGHVRALTEILPRAKVVECGPQDLGTELEKAAAHAAVLGVCGGDGTVNAAAAVALRHGLPLAVLPGGSLGNFARDLGVEDARTLARALAAGQAVRVDVGRFTSGDTRGYFLNSCGLGVHSELAGERNRWSKRIGDRPAGLLAAVRALRADRHQVQVEINGVRRPLWLLFAGNGMYRRTGPVPARRFDLADGRLDVRVVHGGGAPALRLLAAAVAGPLTRSPLHAAVRVDRLELGGLEPGTLLAYDGEVVALEGGVTLDKLPEALTVYRPLDSD
ncbi:bifunctional phosphatase PAP2/diacylglycerol kinase family protein [Streptomyces fructofermentans]|uniref:Phosphoesterase n=1 Tax=Streptomyces fructofermentans TaxID=152141 RepID=A0A918K7K1_9ACTN|nr:bifunctional phosphatase PAP2/diacylglycerol kinase family protein [Streptomyces fructofermentans]GGX53227.1 phosphoesterase [Streptomyces fructofermentans]